MIVFTVPEDDKAGFRRFARRNEKKPRTIMKIVRGFPSVLCPSLHMLLKHRLGDVQLLAAAVVDVRAVAGEHRLREGQDLQAGHPFQ